MRFNFKGFDLNCFEMDGQIWFFGNDVSDILGYSRPRNVLNSKVPANDRQVIRYKEYGTKVGFKDLWVGHDFSNKTLITEFGVYALIVNCQLSAANDFKNWVIRDVLPKIRKNGGYIMGEEKLTKRQQAQLGKEVQRLAKKAEKLAEKNDKLQAQLANSRTKWHRAVSQRKDAQEMKKQAKAELKKYRTENLLWKQDADDAYLQYEKVLEDLNQSEEERMALRDQLSAIAAVSAVASKPKQETTSARKPHSLVYTIDKEGRVIITA